MKQGNDEKTVLEALTGGEESPRPFAVETLPRDLREQLANEIKALPEMQDPTRNPAKALSPRDTERIVSLFHQTLEQVVDRGGFLHDVPLREARIRRMRERIQGAKEELSALCEQMVVKQRALQWLGAKSTSRRHRRTQDPDDGGVQPHVEQVQMEIKNLRAQTRRVSENLLALIHELAEEVQRCERIKVAASQHRAGDSPSFSGGRKNVHASRMVYRPKRSRSV